MLNGFKHFMTKFNFKLIFFLQILTDEISVGLHIKTECTSIVNMVFKVKIMIMKKSLFSSAFNLKLLHARFCSQWSSFQEVSVLKWSCTFRCESHLKVSLQPISLLSWLKCENVWIMLTKKPWQT